ncbi:hypothetical protein BC828DRAFT_374307 [Blastocladiella britannica]|nr:hypothetical protein BC828DRAFT_374307 [Blastocladiella britannica]
MTATGPPMHDELPAFLIGGRKADIAEAAAVSPLALAHAPGHQDDDNAAAPDAPPHSGWCSDRNCAFPQHLTFVVGQEAAPPPHIHSIQILVHNFKIPSRIAIMVGAISEHHAIRWTPYGHVDLSTNAASHYRARELKSIPVSIRGASLVRLVLHAPYQNALNLWNQVALVQVRFHGSSAISAADDDGMPRKMDAPLSLASLATLVARSSSTTGKENDVDTAVRRAPSPSSSALYPTYPTRNAPTRSLQALAYNALEDLAERKRVAAGREEYATAATLKEHADAILDLVRQLEQCDAMVGADPFATQTGAGARLWSQRRKKEEAALLSALARAGIPVPSELLLPEMPVLPDLPTAPPAIALAQAPAPPPPTRNPTMPPSEQVSKPIAADAPAIAPAASPSVDAVAFQELRRPQSPPVPALANKPPSTVLPPVVNDVATVPQPARPARQKPTVRVPPAARSEPRTATEPPVSPVLSNGSAAAEEGDAGLTDLQQSEFRLAIDWLGPHLVARFLDRDFATREAAVVKILGMLAAATPSRSPSPALSSSATNDPVVIVRGAFNLIATCLPDPRERVARWAIDLWSAILDFAGKLTPIAHAWNAASSAFTSTTVSPWPVLLTRAGDTNARVRDAARTVAARTITQWPGTFAPLMVRGFPTGTAAAAWRVVAARVELIAETLPAVGIASSSLGSSGNGLDGGGRPTSMLLKKRASVASKLGASTYRPSLGGSTGPRAATPPGLARGASLSQAKSTGGSTSSTNVSSTAAGSATGGYELFLIQDVATKSLAHPQQAVRDAGAALLMAAAPMTGPTAIEAVLGQVAQKSFAAQLRSRVERLYPAQQPLEGLPRQLRHQATAHNLRQVVEAESESRAGAAAAAAAPRGVRIVEPGVLQQQQARAARSSIPDSHLPPPSSLHAPTTAAARNAHSLPRPSRSEAPSAPAHTKPAKTSPAKPHPAPTIAVVPATATAPASASLTRLPSAESLSSMDEKNKEKRSFWGRLFGKDKDKEKPRNKDSTSTSGPSVAKKGGALVPLPHSTSSAAALGEPEHHAVEPTSHTAVAASPGSDDSDWDWNIDSTCCFCEEVNPNFTQDHLDKHYWSECPVLCPCPHCRQIVEIAAMRTHLASECKSPSRPSAIALPPPDMCILCGSSVGGGGSEAAFRAHCLVGNGCPKATRKPKPGVSYRI